MTASTVVRVTLSGHTQFMKNDNVLERRDYYWRHAPYVCMSVSLSAVMSLRLLSSKWLSYSVRLYLVPMQTHVSTSIPTYVCLSVRCSSAARPFTSHFLSVRLSACLSFSRSYSLEMCVATKM